MEPARANAKPETRRGVGKSILITLPMAIWTLLIFTPLFQSKDIHQRWGGLLAGLFTVALFFMMVRTQETYRWRRIFFVALGFLFPVGFIYELIQLRGSMSIPWEEMLAGNTPFCFLALPMMIIPAALTRTLIFPGSILPTAANPNAVASMVGVWFAGTLVLGKAWCAYGCFFGGLEEGFSSIRPKPLIRKLHPTLRLVPWAVLVTVVLLSLATFSPTYCGWLCPFKAVTEFAEIHGVKGAIQTVLFAGLFIALVVVLPILTKRRTQCAFFCPFGAFQSLFNKVSPFEVRIDREICKDCGACDRTCPTLALSAQSIREGRALHSCMRCGACVDQCPRGAVRWHVRGTPLSARSETARLLFLYAGWAFATMFGGTILAGSLSHIFEMAG
jgi:ferredoxin-type protein NapH